METVRCITENLHVVSIAKPFLCVLHIHRPQKYSYSIVCLHTIFLLFLPLCLLFYLQVKNGRRKRCWCSLHGKLLIFRRGPDDQVPVYLCIFFKIKRVIVLVLCNTGY